MKDKKFLALASFFFLLFFAAVATVALQQPTTQILRAKNATPSPLKSFVIVFPQVGVAASEDSGKTPAKIKVSVFIRDVSGNVLPQRSVKLSADLAAVTITPANTLTTDNLGMAQFFLTSSQAGTVKLQAVDVASNLSVVNIPTVEFTE